MIGGGGERKTLRLVAQYADACNVFGDPVRIHHKYEVLREHCEAIGRDPAEIERSTLQTVKLKTDDRPGDTPAQIVDWFGELSDAGAQHVIFNARDVADPQVIETLGRDVIPGLHALPDRPAQRDPRLHGLRRSRAGAAAGDVDVRGGPLEQLQQWRRAEADEDGAPALDPAGDLGVIGTERRGGLDREERLVDRQRRSRYAARPVR